ncbi:MAG: DUF2461 domain-containing protein [Deltaproteobacteria bacterium]|nr:DUF2461 domain-containing protein [Deltaproteobacteria bacterium]
MATKKKPAKKKPAQKKAAPAAKKKAAPKKAKAKATTTTTAEPRFLPEGRAFLKELARRQDREWFAPRKEEFKALLEEPMRALVTGLGPLLLDTFPAVEDATPKVFRIYRDTRFAKDKSPFKNHVAGELSLGRVGFYVHVGVDDAFAAVGMWQMEPDALKRYRANLVDNDAVGDALLKETQALEKKGFKLMSFDELTRAPTGVSPDHPRIQLLKHKGWAVALPMADVDVAAGGLPAVLAAKVRQTSKAIALFEKALG